MRRLRVALPASAKEVAGRSILTTMSGSVAFLLQARAAAALRGCWPAEETAFAAGAVSTALVASRIVMVASGASVAAPSHMVKRPWSYRARSWTLRACGSVSESRVGPAAGVGRR